MRPTTSSGQSLIEMLIAMMVFALGLATVWVMYLNALHTSRANAERTKASRLALEGLEAVRSIRDGSFASLQNGTWGLQTAGGQWTFSGTSDTQDAFTRQIMINLEDADTAQVTSTVTWAFTESEQGNVSYSTLLTNWRKLSGKSWQFPRIVTTTAIYGNASPLGMYIQGNRLYLTTDEENGESWFLVYDITNEVYPILIGKTSLAQPLYVVRAAGNYAYAGGGDHNPAEVYIMDISSSTNPFKINSIKITGSSNVYGLYASGTQLHVVRGPQGGQSTYFIYNTADPQHISTLGQLNLGGGGFDIMARNGSPPFAFIAGGNNLQEFQIVNTSNPASLAVGGWSDMTGLEDTDAVAVTGTLAFLGSKVRDGNPEFYVYNIANPLLPSTLGTLEIGADIRRLSIKNPVPDDYNDIVFLATASSGHEFMAVDLGSYVNPAILGTADLPGIGIDVANTTDTVYVATDNPSGGLIILQPGP